MSIVGSIASAVVLRMLGLSSSHRQVVSSSRPISWFWKAMVLLGGILFWYGLLVFVTNLMVDGFTTYKTGLGLTITSLGFLMWLIGRTVIYFKRD